MATAAAEPRTANHTTCGTPLVFARRRRPRTDNNEPASTVLYCQTCKRAVEYPDEVVVPKPGALCGFYQYERDRS